MSLIKTEAIVLQCRNYRETSKIVTFYTESHGKIRGIAKGVRSSKSRWGGALQSMAYLNLFFYFKENKDLYLISNAEYVKLYKSISGDFDKMQTGYNIIELVSRTTADNQHNPQIFSLLKNTLGMLELATKNYINLLFYFEFKLCALLGFEIEPKMLDFRLNRGELKSIEYITEGNFNNLLNLNITKGTVKNFNNFFENYFKNHLEHIYNSKSAKVFRSMEANL
jgi:hypothetical protein